MDINAEAKRWSESNGDKTLEQAFVAGFTYYGQFLESVNLKKEAHIVSESRVGGGFCNLKCFYKYNTGENNHFWNGGISPIRQKIYSSIEWKESVKCVWKRDNATCRKCGIDLNSKPSPEPHIHHIISFKSVKHRTDVDNLLLVCKKCHNWIHSSKNKNREFISKC